MNNLINRVKVKNRPIITLSNVFILLESAMLNIIFRAFIRGLNDYKIHKKITRDITLTNRSLYIIYNFIKKVYCINSKI